MAEKSLFVAAQHSSFALITRLKKMAVSWKTTFNRVIAKYNKTTEGGNVASYATQNSRREILEQGFKDLRDAGYKLNDVNGFREKHMVVLAKNWEEKGLAPSTIQNRISTFRTFSEWIGKRGMIKGAEHYVSDASIVKRTMITDRDKSWSGNGITYQDKIGEVQKINPYIAIQLELQREFGLRMKEAALLRPHIADRGTHLVVNAGTKGGRERTVPVENERQRDLLDRAKLMVSSTDSMTPKDKTLSQWYNHYYYVMDKVGITRKDGITSHGLRHERLNEIYKNVTGEKSPVQGGGIIDKSVERVGRLKVAVIAGHAREDIANAYLGKN